jgi:hypothetical protein
MYPLNYHYLSKKIHSWCSWSVERKNNHIVVGKNLAIHINGDFHIHWEHETWKRFLSKCDVWLRFILFNLEF